MLLLKDLFRQDFNVHIIYLLLFLSRTTGSSRWRPGTYLLRKFQAPRLWWAKECTTITTITDSGTWSGTRSLVITIITTTSLQRWSSRRPLRQATRCHRRCTCRLLPPTSRLPSRPISHHLQCLRIRHQWWLRRWWCRLRTSITTITATTATSGENTLHIVHNILTVHFQTDISSNFPIKITASVISECPQYSYSKILCPFTIVSVFFYLKF